VTAVRIVITGGGGFIGSHLVDRCLAEGHDVRILDNFATGRRENLLHVLADVELLEGDVQSYERAYAAVRGCELVFHQAALPSVPRSVQDPLTTNASNVVGTLNVLLAARDSGARRVVLASSSSVYGPGPAEARREDTGTAPISPYAVSKLAGENYARSFFSVYGLETVSLRYFNVFGPRQDPLSQYAAVIPAFATAHLSGARPTVFGDGRQCRDFTFVSNVVDANLLAAQADAVGGEAFNIGCGEPIDLLTVLAELEEITGRSVAPDFATPRPGELRYSCADLTAAQARLGYQPRVQFREGLERTVEYFESRLAEARAPAAG
jgi:UDP-glucose 4-epimerase